jgi:hypothetical protein
MRALTPHRFAHTGKVSLLTLLCRPSIPPPTTSWARSSPSHPRRCGRSGVATQASPWNRKLAAPQRRNGFVILRAARSPPAAPHLASRNFRSRTTQLPSATMWRDLTWVGLSPPDKATSQTHDSGFAASRRPGTTIRLKSCRSRRPARERRCGAHAHKERQPRRRPCASAPNPRARSG